MNKKLKIALAQLNPLVGDVSGNIEKLISIRSNLNNDIENYARSINCKYIFKNNKLFRAPVVLPASVLPGEYKIKILHLRDGLKISEENTNIFVRKTGFEARIYSFAHNYSAFYGIFAIILAILAGYLAALSFRKI